MENDINHEQNWELTNAEKREIKQEVKETIKKEEKEKKKEGENSSIIKETLSKEEKVRNFFDTIEFLWLENEQKEEVALKVKNDALWDKLYWIEIFLSSGIAALWLIQNSVAVVIWAMLIAPLLRPINGVAFAIARWAQSFFTVALKVLFFSVVASIFMGYLISYLVGLNIETNEILARSTPNIIDFFIAVFSAMVAVLSLRFSRLWESIAWVAMAASLMPPLAVVWIGVAMMKWTLAGGAMMLFLTNLVAILLVWTIFFWLYWYTPHIERQQKRMYKWIAFVWISMLVILIPLISTFLNIREKIYISHSATYYIQSVLQTEVQNFSISQVEVKHIDRDVIYLESSIKVPDNLELEGILKKINGSLSEKLWKRVEIDIEVRRFLHFVSE